MGGLSSSYFIFYFIIIFCFFDFRFLWKHGVPYRERKGIQKSRRFVYRAAAGVEDSFYFIYFNFHHFIGQFSIPRTSLLFLYLSLSLFLSVFPYFYLLGIEASKRIVRSPSIPSYYGQLIALDHHTTRRRESERRWEEKRPTIIGFQYPREMMLDNWLDWAWTPLYSVVRSTSPSSAAAHRPNA